MFRKMLLSSVAALGLFSATSALADNNRLVAMDLGAVSPFYGKINPFYGKISPFWGNIQPFWGKIQPFYGKINPFTGNDDFWGTTSAFGANSFLAASGIRAYHNLIRMIWNAAPESQP